MRRVVRCGKPRLCNFCGSKERVFVLRSIGERVRRACASCDATLVESHIAGIGEGENLWGSHAHAYGIAYDRALVAVAVLEDLFN